MQSPKIPAISASTCGPHASSARSSVSVSDVPRNDAPRSAKGGRNEAWL